MAAAIISSHAAACAHLHALSQVSRLPTGDSQGEDISKWLEQVNKAIEFYNESLPANGVRISLHLQEIAFNNAENRYWSLCRQHNAHNAAYPDPPGLETEEEFAANIASWGHMGTAGVENYIVGQHTFYLISAQAPRSFAKAWEDKWFSGSGLIYEEARIEHAAERTPFHCTALYARQGQWRIYDSAYSQDPVPAAETRRLSRISGLTRHWNLFQMLNKRFRTPSKVETGGGGNVEQIGICREMACKWIIGEVLHIMGDSSRRVAVAAWEPLSRT